jgi:uncharacterized protein (DUF433 family)
LWWKPHNQRNKISCAVSIVYYVLKQGMTPDELVCEFSHLSLPQIYDALSYYYENRKAIDDELAVHEEDLKI